MDSNERSTVEYRGPRGNLLVVNFNRDAVCHTNKQLVNHKFANNLTTKRECNYGASVYS